MNMTTEKNCLQVPRSHFQGNGSCDATREANRRADHATGYESEIAPVTDAENQMMQSRAAQNSSAPAQQMQNQMAPNSGMQAQWMQGQTMQNGGMPAQWTPADAAEQDMIDDSYGTEHDHPESEADGMTSIPQDSFNEPLNADEAARNSWRALLARNVGRNVLVRFLMGTQNMVTVEGELYEVGTDYIVIYQPLWDSHITADLYSVKFVEFREPPGVMTLA